MPSQQLITRLGNTQRALASAILVMLLVFPGGIASPAQAQKASRKTLVTVKPEYSELLKHAQIGGLVRLKATVDAEGKVTSVNILGGNPILAESAATAVMKWKYAPAAGQTVEDVSLSFTPH